MYCISTIITICLQFLWIRATQATGEEISGSFNQISTQSEATIKARRIETLRICGTRNTSGVGLNVNTSKEDETEFGEFPWMVAILLEAVIDGETVKDYKCAGSIIAPNVVLTAAHSVYNMEAHLLLARAGEWDMQSEDEEIPHQDARVKEIIYHKNYNKGMLYNDVALLILETSYYWGRNVRPICLPEGDVNFDQSRCFANAWGKKKVGKDGTKILKKVEMPVVSRDICEANLREERLGRYFRLHSSCMCVGGERDKDICMADGGSPLVCPDPRSTRYLQAGIASWGLDCDRGNATGVYADVNHLRSWIIETLASREIYL